LNIAVIGNGAWGLALANLAARRGHSTSLWGRTRRNGLQSIAETSVLAEALSGAEIVLLAVPSHAMREICKGLKPHLTTNPLLISVAKGIEQDTDLRMSEVISEVTQQKKVAVMSGPTFASEVEKGCPSALVCAAPQEIWAKSVQTVFNGEDFRVYTHTDITGVELGGALKNVIAIAAGACVGMGLGDNALAALITRGLAELSRIGVSLGGELQTFYGLSGVGDLILTCSSRQSRNHQVGEGLGRGESLAQILPKIHGTAEGVKTARSVYQMLQKKKLDAPILHEVYLTLYEGKPARQSIKDLMNREPKKEFHATAA
jgi:glycerol-3-phosphate dehydrogenase (NAD(P)+)